MRNWNLGLSVGELKCACCGAMVEHFESIMSTFWCCEDGGCKRVPNYQTEKHNAPCGALCAKGSEAEEFQHGIPVHHHNKCPNADCPANQYEEELRKALERF